MEKIYTHYNKADMDIAAVLNKTREISLMTEELMYYYIDLHFTMPEDLKRKIILCERKFNQAKILKQKLNESSNPDAQARADLTTIIAEEVAKIEAEQEDLGNKLYECLADLRKELYLKGFEILPDLVRAVLKRDCKDVVTNIDNEFRLFHGNVPEGVIPTLFEIFEMSNIALFNYTQPGTSDKPK